MCWICTVLRSDHPWQKTISRKRVPRFRTSQTLTPHKETTRPHTIAQDKKTKRQGQECLDAGLPPTTSSQPTQHPKKKKKTLTGVEKKKTPDHLKEKTDERPRRRKRMTKAGTGRIVFVDCFLFFCVFLMLLCEVYVHPKTGEKRKSFDEKKLGKSSRQRLLYHCYLNSRSRFRFLLLLPLFDQKCPHFLHTFLFFPRLSPPLLTPHPPLLLFFFFLCPLLLLFHGHLCYET